MTAAKLKGAILELERRKETQEKELKHFFCFPYEHPKPYHYPDEVLREAESLPQERKNNFPSRTGFRMGYFSRKTIELLSKPLKKLTDIIAEVNSYNVTAKYSGNVPINGHSLHQRTFGKTAVKAHSGME